ncbi:hypothetical protein T4D_6641 [Trichinella pseudospiralis]|uniref:Uncharacterized protein n=1 Tax=Trichinella pseudospiralis TaxID=6337 RepID=A0A0V1FD99_TRIPS|nr:hypothetical protein T4D_6641 [Trichinella pseudospiralis]
MEKLYQEGIMFDETRSSVRLLWKNSELNLPNDFYMLKRWLEALERRLARKSSAVEWCHIMITTASECLSATSQYDSATGYGQWRQRTAENMQWQRQKRKNGAFRNVSNY